MSKNVEQIIFMLRGVPRGMGVFYECINIYWDHHFFCGNIQPKILRMFLKKKLLEVDGT
jgi:hypothetical protein